MALRYLIASGNVADPTKWDGGVSVPGTGDDCYANGFTGTISANFTVNSLNTTASGAAAAGGGFTCASAVTITCAAGFFAGSTNCLSITGLGAAVGPSYGSLTTTSRVGIAISGLGASHTGNSQGGSFASAFGTSASGGAVQYGDSLGGGASNANGTQLASGSIQVGTSRGSATATAYGTFANGGTHIGDSYGGAANAAYGTRITSGYQYGRSFGGTHVGAAGTFVEVGGVGITTGMTNATGPGLTLANDGAVILQGSTTAAQVNITASAGRYRIDRGVSSVRPFIRPPIYPAYAS